MKLSATLRLVFASFVAARVAMQPAQSASIYWDGTGSDWNLSLIHI